MVKCQTATRGMLLCSSFKGIPVQESFTVHVQGSQDCWPVKRPKLALLPPTTNLTVPQSTQYGCNA